MIHSTMSDNTFYTKPLQWVYAHGKLETFLGNDIVTTSSLETYSKYQEIKYKEKDYSIHETFAINKMGEVKKVRCYFWYAVMTYIPRGLIVLVDDEEAISYAEKQCLARAETI